MRNGAALTYTVAAICAIIPTASISQRLGARACGQRYFFMPTWLGT